MSRPGLQRALSRAELAAAGALALLSVVLQVRFATHAGALWRDEVNSAAFAAMPALSAAWGALRYDGFPILPTLLLRAFAALGPGGDDASLRAFGLLVGLAFLGALWGAGRWLGCPAPLLSLALLGLSPWTIRTVDSVRPYGVGLVGIVLTLGLLWRVVEAPTARRVAAAAALAVLGVQCMYQNAFLLLGVCAAAGATAFAAARPRAAAGVGLAGAAAALSLVPYGPSLAAAREWTVVPQIPPTAGHLARVLAEALRSGGGARLGLWCAMALLVLVLGARTLARRTLGPQGPARELFAAAALVATALAFLAAVALARLPTQPWYWIPLLAVAAPALEAGAWAASSRPAWRVARLGVALGLAALSVSPAWRDLSERRTNLDAVAAHVAAHAVPGDAVVVYPFYFGVTFQRYYRGPVAWATLPPLADLRIHRYDLLKQAMASPAPLDPVFETLSAALRAGRRVWLIGGLPPARPDQPAPSIPPAPHPDWGWMGAPYMIAWGQQAAHFLGSHALAAEEVTLPPRGPVSSYENVPLIVVSGWR